MEFHMNLSPESSSRRREPDTARHILFIGPLSDDRVTAAPSVMERLIVELDPYDIDDAIVRLGPIVAVDPDSPATNLSISRLEDFHPDSLCAASQRLSRMMQLRRSLSKPGQQLDTEISEVEALLSGQSNYTDTSSTEMRDQAADDVETDDDTMARLLGSSRAAESSAQRAASSAVQRLIATAAEQTTTVDSDRTKRLIDELDALATRVLREILGNSSFQAIESSWRSIRWLADRMTDDAECRLSLVDLSFEQLGPLADNENAAAELKIHVARQWRQRLADEPPGLIIAQYSLSTEPGALGALRWLMDLAAEMGAPLVVGADASLAGLTDPSRPSPFIDASDLAKNSDERWNALRVHPAAEHTAVGFPQFVLRQPYGQKSDPIDSFNFEELPAQPDRSTFLWASSAIALAVVWMQVQAGKQPLLEELPMVIYDDGSGQAIMPATEYCLSDSAATALSDKGLSALRASRSTTDVTVQRLVPLGEALR
jgi:type VI secretion system protein ImpC